MVKFKVTVARLAQQSLQDIYRYLYEEASEEVAEKVKNGLIESIESLEKMPERNGIVHEISDEKTTF